MRAASPYQRPDRRTAAQIVTLFVTLGVTKNILVGAKVISRVEPFLDMSCYFMAGTFGPLFPIGCVVRYGRHESK
jgi:hypothetical protein